MLLLDTHIWIRWQNMAKGNLALPRRLVELIETADRVAISAISCWELGQLVKTPTRGVEYACGRLGLRRSAT